MHLWEERTGDPVDWVNDLVSSGEVVKHGGFSSSECDPTLDESSMEGSCKTSSIILPQIPTYIVGFLESLIMTLI